MTADMDRKAKEQRAKGFVDCDRSDCSGKKDAHTRNFRSVLEALDAETRLTACS
jgi:hypothetical protein